MAGQPLDDDARLRALDRTGLLDAAHDPVLDRLTRLAARVVGAPVSLVSLVDPGRQHFAAEVGLPPEWSERAETPLTHSFCRLVVTSGERLVVTDAKADVRVQDNLAIPDLGVQAYAGFPLVDEDGNVLGSFCVIDDAPREWTEDELESVADIAAAAASEIRARAALRTATARVSLLAEATRALHTDLDVLAAAQALADHLVPALADLCVVDLAADVTAAPRDAGSARTSVVVARDAQVRQLFLNAEARRPRISIPSSGVHRILAGGPAELVRVDPAVLGRVAQDDEQLRLYLELGLVEVIMAPIVSRQGVEGVLTLGSRRGARPYDADDVRLAEEIGRRVGVAVENARLYGHERDTALTLQHSLLPRLPDLDGLDLAARYLPSAHSGQVGGDWYDVLTLPDGDVGVAVGDVAGHDVAAAAGMGQLRAVLRSYAWDDASPGRVLDRVCSLVRGLDEDTMATVLYARLGPPREGGARTLVYASAGHPPPVLLLDDGSTRLLGTVSPVIGIETDPRAEERVELPRGATLVCYSDGLVERRGEDLALGIERLRRVVADSAARPVDDLAQAVLDGMLGGRLHEDDVALLVLRVR
ncbi:MAG TPA: SpoIIE family protein phosphatase [Kineosporiaceae bacterium]|nr:SpoIIE family protein phosphatase [Kineosporiaceae bacterium]